MNSLEEVIYQIDTARDFLGMIKRFAENKAIKDRGDFSEYPGLRKTDSYNYIIIGNQHIFLNFKEDNLINVRNIKNKENQKIHVFVNTVDSIIPFAKLVKEFSNELKITIHQWKGIGISMVSRRIIDQAISQVSNKSWFDKSSYDNKYKYEVTNKSETLFRNKNGNSIYIICNRRGFKVLDEVITINE